MIFSVLKHPLLSAFSLLFFCAFTVCLTFNAEGGSDPFVFAVSPMASPAATASNFSEFIDYLSFKLGRKVIFKQRKRYSEINHLLKTGSAMAAYTCTGAYLAGREEFGLELLATPVINGRSAYYSYIIVNNESSFNSLEDLKGKTFAFTDPLSLTGRIYVTSLLNERGLNTKDFFGKTFYTAGHEKSIEAVANKLADAASIDSLVLEDMKAKGNPYASAVRVIMVSKPFGMPPFVVSPKTPQSDRRAVLKILLNMPKDKRGKQALKKAGIEGFQLPDYANYISAYEARKKVWE